MLARAFERLEPLFMETVLPKEGHGLLASEEEWSSLLESLPECANEVRLNLAKHWTTSTTSPQEKWIELKKHIAAFKKKIVQNNKSAKTLSAKDRELLETWPVEVVFLHTYPKLDVEVSKKRNHLLKSPFCVHPKTGRVCVPITDIKTFDPFSVPTLPQIVQELDKAVDEDKSNRPEWYKTSLRKYFEPLKQDFLDPIQAACRLSNRNAKDKEAAVNVEF
jgi:DNA primase small subunit